MLGLLGMLPPLCFAVFGILTPLIAKRFGLEPTLDRRARRARGRALGRASRAALGLVAASTLTFAAIGVANVLLPPLVKRYFPDRVGLMTSLYVTAMSISTFMPPLIAVPVADAAGWRVSLGEWAIVAALSLVPWIALLVHPRRRGRGAARRGRPRPPALRAALTAGVGARGRVRDARLQQLRAFAWLPAILHDLAGVSPAEAGALLALYAAMGLPAGLIVPIVAARYGKVRLLVAVAIVALAIGYLGLLLVPTAATWLWVALAGIGPMLFPLALVLINLRSRTHSGAVGPLGVRAVGGLPHGRDRSAAVGMLPSRPAAGSGRCSCCSSAVPAAIAGAVVARPRYFEDERAA